MVEKKPKNGNADSVVKYLDIKVIFTAGTMGVLALTGTSYLNLRDLIREFKDFKDSIDAKDYVQKSIMESELLKRDAEIAKIEAGSQDRYTATQAQIDRASLITRITALEAKVP